MMSWFLPVERKTSFLYISTTLANWVFSCFWSLCSHMSWNKRSHQSHCVLRILISAVMVLTHRRGRVAEQKRAIRAIRAVQAHILSYVTTATRSDSWWCEKIGTQFEPLRKKSWSSGIIPALPFQCRRKQTPASFVNGTEDAQTL
jgi:hypothetical protein